MNHTAVLLAAASLLAVAAPAPLAVGQDDAFGVPGRAKPVAADAAWNQAEVVIVGELTDHTPGPVAQSFPPIHTNRLTFKVVRTLRGAAGGESVACHYAHRGEQNYPFVMGTKYIVALSTARDGMAVAKVRPADPEGVREAELSCSLPMGWRLENNAAVSPWAALGKAGWAAELPADVAQPALACLATGRPALPAGAKVAWSAEPVPPKKAIEWTNPDGDGEYALTVGNPTDEPLTVPALLAQDGKVLWTECVVVLCQGKAYALPGAKGVSGKVAPLVLKPKESATTVVNALALTGPEWPRGGDRVEFTFCLGERSKAASFYYMSRHHDGFRDAAQKAAAAAEKQEK